MRRTLLGLLAAVMVAAPLAVAAPASATEDDGTPYVLVAWQMPDDGSGWPQQFVLKEDTAAVSIDLLDDELAALPGCHKYQVDLYGDTQMLADLIAFGVLGGEGSPPEPGVVTWKYFTGGADCGKSIGGRTIGFWGNKNGTAAEYNGHLWDQVNHMYPATGFFANFASVQFFLKNVSSSTNLGKDMLKAQFIATALNSLYISGYSTQYVAVPADVATLLGIGTCVKVETLLQAVNSGWLQLDTKAEITSVKDVLDRINQDVPVAPLQCNPAT